MQELYEAAKELLTQPQVTTWGKLKKATEEYERTPKAKAPSIQTTVRCENGEEIELRSYHNTCQVQRIIAMIKTVAGMNDGPTQLQLWIQHPSGKAQVRISSPYNNPEAAEIFWYLDYHLRQKAKAEGWELQCTTETSKAILEYEQNIKCPKLVTNKPKEPHCEGYVVRVDSRAESSFIQVLLDNGYSFELFKEWPKLCSVMNRVAVWVSPRCSSRITRVDVDGKTIFDHHNGQTAALREHYEHQINRLEEKKAKLAQE